MIPQNRLSGNLVRLTLLRRDDVSTILEWRQDTRFLRLWNSDPFVERTETQICDWINGLGKTERELAFAIRLLDSEEIIGTIGLDEIEWSNRVAGLGIGIGNPKNWGKGYGTEATKLLIDYAFNDLNLFRIQLTVFDFNSRAIALYEGMGFKKEGTFREFLERDGKRHDMLLYGLLRCECQSPT